MTEQCVSQQMSQDDARRSNRGSAKHVERDYHSEDENVEERPRYERLASEALLTIRTEQQEHSGRRKPALIRSKTFDHSMLTQVHTDRERKKPQYSQLSKSNSQYHKIFKEISKEEQLIQSYTCALQKDILYQGRMFVSSHWICFHSKVFGKDTKIAIPVMSVTHIKKTKTAILVPNALVIATANDRYVFVSFLSRDNTYKILMSVCLHLEEKSPCSSPIPSSAKSSFRGQRSHHFTLNCPGDFSDLDGALGQRRQEMEESSSSDSQIQDYDKRTEFPVPPFLDVLKRTASPQSPDHGHKVEKQNKQKSHNQRESHHSGMKAGVSCVKRNPFSTEAVQGLVQGSEQVIDSRTVKSASLNTVLFVYLFLVCVLLLSSCYLAFKIILLEQKLSRLGPVQEFAHQDDDFLWDSDVNTEHFSELLSINLLKLEKVQKSLQRLLDDVV